MAGENEALEIIEENKQKYEPKTAKQRLYFYLLSEGLTPKEAAKQAGIHPFHGYKLQARAKKQGLLRPKILKLVDQVQEKILQDYLDGKDKVVTQAASMVSEAEARRNPVVRQNLNLNVNTEIDPVDFNQLLDQYRGK